MTAKLVEFLGMPRVGKTHQIQLLERELKKRGYSVLVMGGHPYLFRSKSLPAEIIADKLVFFANVLEEFYQNKEELDFIIIDRGFYDSLVWFDVEALFHHISVRCAKELKKTFAKFSKKVDKLVCLMLKAPVRKDTSSKYLDILQKSYKNNRKLFKNAIFITKQESPARIHKRILNFVVSGS